MRGVSRVFTLLSFGLVTSAWVGFGWLPWWSDQRVAELDVVATVPNDFACPNDDRVARKAARQLLRTGDPIASDHADRLLRCSTALRPLYGPTWLLRARTALQLGDPERADAHLRLATTLWPERSRLLWEAAVVRAELGDADGTLELAGRFLRAAGPADTRRALWLAERVEPDPARLVPALVAATPAVEEREEILRRILLESLARRDVSLADAAWRTLPEPAREGRELTHAYLEALLAGGATGRAVAIWRARHPHRDDLASIEIGGFEESPTHRGFDWRIARRSDSEWSRDDEVVRQGKHSLRVRFDSDDDSQFVHASRLVPVAASRSYRLRGYWRGEDLSTSSGPYLEARVRDGRRLASLPSRVGSWDWEAFNLDFAVPAGLDLIEIRLRRDPEGLHRGFSGSIWLDALVLAEIGGDPHG